MTDVLNWLLGASREVLVTVLVLYATVDTSLSWGFAPGVFQGFAPRNEMSRAQAKIDELRDTLIQSFAKSEESTLRMRLFNLRAQQCAALKNRNLAFAASLAQEYDKAMVEYFNLTKIQYQLKSCNEF